MQTNVAPAAGQVLKITVIALIIFFFISFLLVSLPGIPFSLRTTVYQAFKKGMNLFLNHQTAYFNTLESENFILKYSEEERDISAFVLDTAENYYPVVQEMINFRPEQRAMLILYHDQKALNKSFGWAGDKSAVGAYWAGSIRILSPLAWAGEAADTEIIKSVFLKQGPLSHELTHYIIDEKTRGNYSRWLSEGLAQYVEEKITGFRLEEPPLEQRKELYSLAQLDREYDKMPNQTLAYWQSLLTVRSLIDEYGMEQMQSMLDLLGKGFKMEEALQKTYGITVLELEQKIRESI